MHQVLKLSAPFSPEAGLGEGQQHQSVSANCTTLTMPYNLQSPHNEEHLVLCADGPYKDSIFSLAIYHGMHYQPKYT